MATVPAAELTHAPTGDLGRLPWPVFEGRNFVVAYAVAHGWLKCAKQSTKLAMIPCAVNWFESMPGQRGFELFCLNLTEVHGLEPNFQERNSIIFNDKRPVRIGTRLEQ